MTTSVQQAYLSRDEAAEFLGVTAKWLANTGRTLGVPSVKFGGLVRYPLEELSAWAQQQ